MNDCAVRISSTNAGVDDVETRASHQKAYYAKCKGNVAVCAAGFAREIPPTSLSTAPDRTRTGKSVNGPGYDPSLCGHRFVLAESDRMLFVESIPKRSLAEALSEPAKIVAICVGVIVGSA